MALPLPRVIADVGPGGPLVTSLGGINKLHNDMLLRKINAVKEQYAPITTQAEAASKLAYANLMGPQFLAKLYNNPEFVGNLKDAQAKAGAQSLWRAGTGQGTGASIDRNAINDMPGVNQSITPPANPLSWVYDHLKNLVQPKDQPRNTFAQPNMSGAQQDNVGEGVQNPGPVGEISPDYHGYDNSGNPNVSYDGPGPIDYGNPNVGRAGVRRPMNLEVTQGQNVEPTYGENAGKYKGIVNEGTEAGKLRAKDIDDIGQQQMGLSNSGTVLDKLVGDINDPTFMSLRSDFPFYQDMQLTGLSKIGNPAQQEAVGNFISDVQSFAGATVNSFKGQTMKREFDYAEKLKPNENDTVNSARGKLTALKTLKEVAEQKNEIILDLMQHKHMSVGDAVKQANKAVDWKAIDAQVKKATSPMITLKSPTGMTIRLPLWEARQRGMKNV